MKKMTQVKKLYLGTKIEDLQKRSALPDVGATKTKMLLETARKLFREAEKRHAEGDEELAYVLYMKYFNLLNCIHKKPDYSQHKQFVQQILGGNKKNTDTMDKLEQLCKSLNRRYSRQNDDAATTSTITSTASMPSPVRDYESLSASEKFDRLKAETSTHILSPAAGELLSVRSLNVISCKELFDRMQENKVLVMDCRLSPDHQHSHLTYNWAFNVPEEHIIPGMSAGKLQDRLDSQSKALWSARCVKEQIVLMDWSSKEAGPSTETTIGTLLDILQNWDPDVNYRSPIKILDGGYEYFIMMYPTLCTNPSVQAPQQNNNSVDLIDDIEYPSIHDITMKDDIRERGYSLSPSRANASAKHAIVTYPARPSVDRASKLAAIKKYDEDSPIVEIQREQEELLERAQFNDEQLKLAQTKWEAMFEEYKGQQVISNKREMASAEQELVYNFMQLESRAEDYKMENIRLREELEKYKSLEREQEEKLTPNEVENIEEATKQIETKIQERQILDEQHEREKEQREKQLAIARENKRHMKPASVDDAEVSQPKIPQFDRSVKPQMPAVMPATTVLTAAGISGASPFAMPNRETRSRDFSPVSGAMGRGLTGLKNLGNTCYMNSILQCLSNTPQLTEYCTSDRYKNYINRNNRTRGQIVDEVAALIKMLWTGNYKCVASKDLRYVIGQFQQIFRGIEQQDSHEFLTILMDWLHSDLQTLLVQEKLRDTLTASERAWLEFTKAKESHILHLFYGQLKSTVKCALCFKESATYECFSSLSLELPPNSSVCYLSQCMDMYFSGERIHGWNCPNCKQKREAIKTLGVSKLPPVLIIHLKRFYADTDSLGNSYKKKQNYVRFPLENLDMTPHITKSEARSATPKGYQLYGVSNHYGSMESGHYTAFCKSSTNGRWYKFDDQVVTPLDPSNVYSSAGYILFYTRLSTPQN